MLVICLIIIGWPDIFYQIIFNHIVTLDAVIYKLFINFTYSLTVSLKFIFSAFQWTCMYLLETFWFWWFVLLALVGKILAPLLRRRRDKSMLMSPWQTLWDRRLRPSALTWFTSQLEACSKHLARRKLWRYNPFCRGLCMALNGVLPWISSKLTFIPDWRMRRETARKTYGKFSLEHPEIIK